MKIEALDFTLKRRLIPLCDTSYGNQNDEYDVSHVILSYSIDVIMSGI